MALSDNIFKEAKGVIDSIESSIGPSDGYVESKIQPALERELYQTNKRIEAVMKIASDISHGNNTTQKYIECMEKNISDKLDVVNNYQCQICEDMLEYYKNLSTDVRVIKEQVAIKANPKWIQDILDQVRAALLYADEFTDDENIPYFSLTLRTKHEKLKKRSSKLFFRNRD